VAAASIAFTDGIGAAVLNNGMGAVAGGLGSQFHDWTSEQHPIGVAKTALGTGARYMFKFRDDYLATFTLMEIPNANVVILDRLIAWLLLGGTCSVTTGDTLASVYATCGLAEGVTPQKKMSNKNDISWDLTLTLVNLGAAAPMTCVYAS
jgi:hypothetical protein